MIVLVLAIIGAAAFLAFIAYLNGSSSPTRHIETPPSWGDGGVGDDWYRKG